MHRLAAGAVGDLVAATGAVGDDDGVGRLRKAGSRLSSAIRMETS